jgi:ABC-type lipoprotein export system ATPase subunit
MTQGNPRCRQTPDSTDFCRPRGSLRICDALTGLEIPDFVGLVSVRDLDLMAHLEIQNLEKIYAGAGGGVAALRGVSFTVQRGEFVALWGPSGCGKSTLLHIIGGMDRPTRGTVRLDGRALETLSRAELAPFRRRDVGFVFQSYHLLPTLTVVENVALPLTLDGRGQAESHRRAAELLEQVGLGSKTHRLPSELSGGEMQRAAVARAIVHQPQVLLADEPTGSLDSENGRRVMLLLDELNKQHQLTILLATHSAEAARSADRILRIRDGRLENDVHERASSTL